MFPDDDPTANPHITTRNVRLKSPFVDYQPILQ